MNEKPETALSDDERLALKIVAVPIRLIRLIIRLFRVVLKYRWLIYLGLFVATAINSLVGGLGLLFLIGTFEMAIFGAAQDLKEHERRK